MRNHAEKMSLQGSKFVVAIPCFLICYRDAHAVANICYCHKFFVLLIYCMHFCVMFVMRSATPVN